MMTLTFLRYAFGRLPLLLSLTTCVLVVVSVLEGLSLLMIAPVIDIVLGNQGSQVSEVSRRVAALLRAVGLPLSLGTALTLFLAINIVKAGVQTLSVYGIVRSKYALLRDLMRGTFEDCLFARWEFFTSRAQGTLLNLFIRSVWGHAVLSTA